MFQKSFQLLTFALFPLFLFFHLKTSFASTAPSSQFDGVIIEAVEAYPNQSKSEILLGGGIYPFNPYYNSFIFDLGYDYWVSRWFTWEILSFNYLYSVNNGLTEQLADNFGVNPTTIERPNYTVSSEGILHFSYGKFTFIDQKIRYFKTGLLIGGGILQTTQHTLPTANLGLRFDCHVNDTFSWKIEIRDILSFSSGYQNYLSIHLGGGISL